MHHFSKRTQKGVGLIEVLISVLVLSIGILTMTALQVSAKRTGLEALQRTTAVATANEFFERMRNNGGALASYDTGTDSVGDGTLVLGTNCEAATCTVAQLAAFDLYQLEQQLIGASEKVTISGVVSNTGGLTDPRVCIANTANVVTIAISWRGAQPLGNPADAVGCGAGDGLYDGPDADDEYRQTLVISSYVSG